MKIIYTIAGLYRPAGMERILTGKANYLAEHGHEVLIVTTEQKGRSAAFELHSTIRCVDLGIGYEDNNGASVWSKLFQYPGKHRRHKKALRELLMRERPDITVSMFCGDETFLPLIKDGSKKVLEVHFSRFKRLQYDRAGLWGRIDRLRSRQESRIPARFDRFVTLTREDLGYWGNPQNGTAIPNFIDKMPDEISKCEGGMVAAVGRLCHQKGFDRLIDAWKIVRRNDASRGWKLIIVGDGEDRYQLQKQINDLGLTDYVKLKGPCNNMKPVYQSASVLALTSRYEGLPMVLLEAQGYGIPSVCFDCKCGPRDVITDGEDGVLVKDGDIEAFAEALIALMRDEGLRQRMGTAARIAAVRWDKEAIMQQWLKLFGDVCSEQGSRKRL